MKLSKQNGFAHLGLILLMVIVLAVIVFGYRAVNKNNNDTSVTSGVPVQQVQTIRTKADLGTATSTLNNENIDGDLNPDTLNQDVNSLL